MAARLFARSASRKRIVPLSAFAGDAGVAHVLVAHQGAQVGGGRVEALGQRALHVHLQQEMHAAAQVEAEIHRQGVIEVSQFGEVRQQVERHL
jgi:hypothetical protein